MQLESSEHNLISHYGPGEISVNGEPYASNVLITESEVISDWFDGSAQELAVEHFEPLLKLAQPPEIVLFGSGATHTFPDFQVLAELKTRGITLEVMNTRAACRPYSVLVSEHRSVAAALLQIEE